jgi:hypothetical protein
LDLLAVEQLPALVQIGYLHGSLVEQVLQLTPLSPHFAVVLPGWQVLPSQQPLHRPFWMHLHDPPLQLRLLVQGPPAEPQTHLLPLHLSVVVLGQTLPQVPQF